MSEQPLVLGLTGLACAGKSSVAAIFADLGATVIDVDKVGHETLRSSQVEEALRAAFGPAIFRPDGTLDRKALGGLAFASDASLQQLEDIVHPVMIATTKERAAAAIAAGRSVIIDAAILHYLRLDQLCAKVFLVTAPFELRLERARSRNWSEQELKLRDEAFGSRLPDRLEVIEIDNSGLLPQLQEKIISLWKEL